MEGNRPKLAREDDPGAGLASFADRDGDITRIARLGPMRPRWDRPSRGPTDGMAHTTRQGRVGHQTARALRPDRDGRSRPPTAADPSSRPGFFVGGLVGGADVRDLGLEVGIGGGRGPGDIPPPGRPGRAHTRPRPSTRAREGRRSPSGRSWERLARRPVPAGDEVLLGSALDRVPCGSLGSARWPRRRSSPPSRSRHATIVPVRPRPPRQATTTDRPARSRPRTWSSVSRSPRGRTSRPCPGSGTAAGRSPPPPSRRRCSRRRRPRARGPRPRAGSASTPCSPRSLAASAARSRQCRPLQPSRCLPGRNVMPRRPRLRHSPESRHARQIDPVHPHRVRRRCPPALDGEEPIDQRRHDLAPAHPAEPLLGDAVDAPVDPGKPAGDGRGGIGVVAVRDRPLDRLLVRLGTRERIPGAPERVPNATPPGPLRPRRASDRAPRPSPGLASRSIAPGACRRTPRAPAPDRRSPASSRAATSTYSAHATWARGCPCVTLDARIAPIDQLRRPTVPPDQRHRQDPHQRPVAAGCSSIGPASAAAAPASIAAAPHVSSRRYRTPRRHRAYTPRRDPCHGTATLILDVEPDPSAVSESSSANISAPSSLHVPGGWPCVPGWPNRTSPMSSADGTRTGRRPRPRPGGPTRHRPTEPHGRSGRSMSRAHARCWR